MGLKSEEAMERDLGGYATMLCYYPFLSQEVLGDREFGIELKKRAATIDCSQLPAPLWEDRVQAR